MPITSHDVARLAGVSQPTVSRALRADSRVADSTRQRVREAAQALGYVPSVVGRSLSTQVTKQIAMVADLDNPLYPQLVGPVHDVLLARGYRTVILAERGDDMATYERLLDRSVDGAILTTSLLRSSLPFRLRERGLPIVQLNRVSDLVDADQVTADNERGAAEVARLFLSLHHREIGAILGPAETSTSRDREVGFRGALQDAGIALPSRWVHHGQSFSHADGSAGFISLMQNKQRPTAVFCVNDIVAVGALNAAIELGIRIPEDVALVGFDDLEIAAWPCFLLTTVRTDVQAMARRSAELIIDRISQDASAQAVHDCFPARLVSRRTHAVSAR